MWQGNSIDSKVCPVFCGTRPLYCHPPIGPNFILCLVLDTKSVSLLWYIHFIKGVLTIGSLNFGKNVFCKFWRPIRKTTYCFLTFAVLVRNNTPIIRLKILIKQHLASHWVPTSKFGSDIPYPLTQFQCRGGSCRFVFVAGRFGQCVRWLIGAYFPERMS